MRAILLGLSILLLAMPAWAQASVPAGWVEQARTDLITFTSPDTGNGQRVTVSVTPYVAAQGRLDSWLIARAETRASSAGRITNRSGPSADGAAWSAGFVTRASSGALTKHYIYAADPPNGRILVEIRHSSTISDDDLTLSDGIDLAADFLQGGLFWTPPAPAPAKKTAAISKSPATPAPAPRAGTPARAPANTSGIEAVIFWNRMSFGYGGMMRSEPAPMVLFSDGTASYDIAALTGDKAAHKRAYPDEWTAWRKVGSRYQYKDYQGQWTDQDFDGVLGPASAGYRLNGTYRRSSGMGLPGGANQMAVSGVFSFDRQGRFSTSTVVTGRNANADFGGANGDGGTYAIDGFFLTLTWADGRTERGTIVINTQSDPAAVWIDGDGWVKE